MQEPTQEELAEDVTNQFMNSQHFAMRIEEALKELKPTALEIIFAFKIVDRELTRVFPHWEEARDWGAKHFDMLQENGAFVADEEIQ